MAYFLPWISWGMISITGFEMPFTCKKITNLSNKILFFSKKGFLYTAFYIYSVPILAILSGVWLFVRKELLGKIFLLISLVNGLIVSLYMFFYLATSSVLKIKNGSSGIYLLFVCSLFGICYLISRWILNNKTKRLKQQYLNELADI